MPSASQIRAARAMLDWSREDLAAATGMTSEGLSKIERGTVKPTRSTEDKIVGAFLGHGIVFIEEDGVKRHTGGVKVYKGGAAFALWFDDIYETIKDGGEIAVTGARESDYARWLNPEDDLMHTERMNAIAGKVKCRVILCEGDRDFLYSTYVKYRWIAKERWDQNPLYMYGLKLAIVEFTEEGPIVTVIDAPAAARAFRKIFETMWDASAPIPSAEMQL